MNIFSRFGIKEVSEDLQDYTKLLSSDMQNKICLWLQMANGKAPWNVEEDGCKPSGVIPSIIGAISDPVTEEMKIESENEELKNLMNDVHHKAPENVANMVTVGSTLVRPVYSGNRVQFEFIKNGFYLPTSYDLDGTLTGAIILKKVQDGKKLFLMVEKHTFTHPIHSVDVLLYEIKTETMQKSL